MEFVSARAVKSTVGLGSSEGRIANPARAHRRQLRETLFITSDFRFPGACQSFASSEAAAPWIQKIETPLL